MERAVQNTVSSGRATNGHELHVRYVKDCFQMTSHSLLIPSLAEGETRTLFCFSYRQPFQYGRTRGILYRLNRVRTEITTSSSKSPARLRLSPIPLYRDSDHVQFSLGFAHLSPLDFLHLTRRSCSPCLSNRAATVLPPLGMDTVSTRCSKGQKER